MTDYFNLNICLMDKYFYKKYIRNHIQTNILNKCDYIIKQHKFIEYYSIKLGNESETNYDELLLLDILDKRGNFLPIFISNIISTSEYNNYNKDKEKTNKTIETIQLFYDELNLE